MDWLIVLGLLAVVAVAVFWIRGKHKVPTYPPAQGVDYANLGQNHGPDDGPKGPPSK
jgi:hypothetical protein